MRRAVAALAALVAVVLVAACGTTPKSHGHLSVSRVASHGVTVGKQHAQLAAYTLADGGSYSAQLHWDITWTGHTATGYYVYVGSTQEADVASSPWIVTGMDCGTTYTLGVKAHDGSGNVSAEYTQDYTTPDCVVDTPVNTTAPAFVSGTSIQGQTLSVSDGDWSNAPTGYTYQWQRCTFPSYQDTSCSDISGATSSTYTTTSSDAGDSLRAVVTAANSGGPASADTPVSGSVASSQTAQTTCFQSPGTCGYPDPNYGNVGVPAGTILTNVSGGIAVSSSGCSPSGSWCTGSGTSGDPYTIDGVNATGQITITTSNVVVENSKVTISGGGSGYMNGDGQGSAAVAIGNIAGGATVDNVQLTDDTFTNADDGTTIQHAVYSGIPGGNSPTNVVGDGLYAYSQSDGSTDTTTCTASGNSNVAVDTGGVDSLWWGPGTIENSYEYIGNLYIACDHIENIYEFAGSPLDVDHNTLFNADGQTTNVFVDGKGGAADDTINNNLLGGGQFVYYPGGNSATGSATVTNNRIARCGAARALWVPSWFCPLNSSTGGTGGTPYPNPGAGSADQNPTTPDGLGFFPKGGASGPDGGEPTGGTNTYTGNIWDNTASSDTFGP